ncbi:MAG: NADH-quinone oxidoreductase subunit NuoG [candidate division Zixibacteria bacterium]|nr:NADH-quinone oxidoreductase subunit NuoG [candidate division Zixibacteria bacterium]
MADLIKLNIDGQDVEVAPGTLLIKAAKKLGIEIPTFCFDDRLKPVGSCRLCLVEVEKAPKLIASCATPVGPGMVVHTSSERVVKARKGVLEFLLINHPLDCPTCDKGGECPLQNQTIKYGPSVSRYRENKIRVQDDPNMKYDDIKLGPEIWLNKNRCITCFKCVRIARDLAGGIDLGIFYRGAFANVDIPTEMKYKNEFSGNTVEFCPVGALMSDSFRYKIRNWLLEKSNSVSWLCPDGSNIIVEHNQGKIYRHYSRRNDNVDMGFLCDKDRYCFDITRHPDRLLQPLGNNNGSLTMVNYGDALARAVHRVAEENGQSSALLLDTTLTNEEAFSASEYFKTYLSGSSIGISSELDIPVKESVSGLGLQVSMTELEEADLIIIAGCDLAAEHPIIGLRVKKLIQKGTPVYLIGSRKMGLGRFRVNDIRAVYGNEAETIENIIALKKGKGNAGFAADIGDKLKSDIEKANNTHILSGADLLNNPNRTRFWQSLKDLGGALDAKLSVLTTETNYLGVKLCGHVNSTIEDIVKQIEDGKIKTLFVAGGDPVSVYPDRMRISKAFARLDYLIYWGAFKNATANLATLVFPSLLPTENAGSYINIERRLQFMRKPYAQSKGITSITKLFTDIKTELEGELFYSPAEVFAKMADSLPEFKGLKYEFSEGYVIPATDSSRLELKAESDTMAPNDYPFVLTFGRSVYYGGSGITAKSETLRKLTPAQTLMIHPEDATRLGIEAGNKVLLKTSNGSTGEFELMVSYEVDKGNILIYGWSEDNAPNKFMTGYNKPVFADLSGAKS